MTISGSTKVVGLFGDPVEHTLSPRMQNAAFRNAGLDFCYVPFHVAPTQLGAAVAAVRALGLAGVNVTIPHKVAALDFVDEVAEEARRVGAINTVVNRDGWLVGHNTDVFGVLEALHAEAGEDPAGKKAVVIGAGGAARACVFALADRGAGEVVILNRTLERAESLARDFDGEARTGVAGAVRVVAGPLTPAEVRKRATEADFFINASSLGLRDDGGGRLDESPFGGLFEDLSFLQPWCVVCDLVYRPGGTPLVRRAKTRGLRAVDGLSVLIYQGARSFELWTGREAPVAVMKEALVGGEAGDAAAAGRVTGKAAGGGE